MDLTRKNPGAPEKGNEVIPCKWEDVGFFSEGLAYAEDAFGRIGFIDKTGKVVIPCQWEDAAPFLNGKAFVKDKEGAWHQIDKEGNFITVFTRTNETADIYIVNPLNSTDTLCQFQKVLAVIIDHHDLNKIGLLMMVNLLHLDHNQDIDLLLYTI